MFYKTKKQGSTTGLVLMVTVVLLILGAAYNMLVRQRSRLVNKQALGEITFTIGEAFLEMSSEMLRNMLKDPSSEIFQTLVKPWPEFSAISEPKQFELTLNSTQGTLTVTDLFNEPLEKITQAYGGASTIDVTALAIVNPKNFKELKSQVDKTALCNKTGTIQLNLDISFQGASRRIGVEHQTRVLTARPPVFRKFTLFMDTGLHSTDKEAYNCIKVDSRGEIDGLNTPVTISNGYAAEIWPNFTGYPPDITGSYTEKFKKLIMERMGWIYLGSGPVNLNLTHGTSDNTYSEDFHFFRMTSDPNSGRAYKDPRVESGELTYSTELKLSYQINRWDKGLYYFPSSTEQEKHLISQLHPKYALTSLFHLYGHYAPGQCQASPTLVYGQVAARYLSLAAIRRRTGGTNIDLIDDNHKFFPLPFVSASTPTDDNIYNFFVASKFGQDQAKYYKRSAMLAFEGQSEDGSVDNGGPLWTNWQNIYKDVMSSTRLRAYNASMDFIREANMQITISDNTVSDNYLNIDTETVTAQSYDIPSNDDLTPDINNVKAVLEQVKNKSYFSSETKPEFCRIFKDAPGDPQTGSSFMAALEKSGMLLPPGPGSTKKQLNLSSLVYVDGSVQLGDIEILTSAVIVAKDGITITGDISMNGNGGRNVLLTLCSHRNITVNTEATDISASLIALNGTIFLKGPSPLNITGNMIMKSFSQPTLDGFKRRALHLNYNLLLSAKPGESDYADTCFIDINPNPSYLER
jgi:hypothetical protein